MNIILSRVGILGLLLVCSIICRGQVIIPNGKEADKIICLAATGISSSTEEYLNLNNVKYIVYLTSGQIDHGNDGLVDSKRVEQYLKKYFPDENSSGICVIDWERKAMSELKKFISGGTDDTQMGQYEKLVDMIKELRPNVLVGIYGLPYYYSKNGSELNFKKIYSLLNTCDFIAPSLYVSMASQKAIDYLKRKLRVALVVGQDLDKPVLPFVAFRAYGKSGGQHLDLLSGSYFRNYIRSLKNYSVKGGSISGVILWNGDRWEYVTGNKKFSSYSKQSFNVKFNSIVMEYVSIVVDVFK